MVLETTADEKKRASVECASFFGSCMRELNSDIGVMRAMHYSKQKKRNQLIEDEIEAIQCKVRYYR